MFKKIGPGVLVAAAFVGPGTITACTLAGVGFGYALLWAMLLSVFTTMALQEMAARLGIITQGGLADAIKKELTWPWVRNSVLVIILAAILVGNAAYEAGNISGASLGIEALFGQINRSWYPWVIALLAFLLLWMGNYRTLEKAFMLLIFLMSLSFIATAALTRPNIIELFKGLFVPSLPNDSLLLVIALVGTTVVPYNLFLHASLVSEKWKSARDVKAARWDTLISIGMGGMVSMSIIIAAAAIPTREVTGVMDLALGLEPLFGGVARYFMGIGLFAAGITSSITAPLAAAYVANSCFGWKAGLKDTRFRAVWISILLLGTVALSFDITPIEVIKFAQIANGILLPAIAILLVWMANRGSVMGHYKNTVIQNVLGVLIIVLSLVLGAKSVLRVFGMF